MVANRKRYVLLTGFSRPNTNAESKSQTTTVDLTIVYSVMLMRLRLMFENPMSSADVTPG